MRQLEFRKFRFLFFVLGLTLLAALWELAEPDPEGNPREILFPLTWSELYPESADAHYEAARRYVEQGDYAEARIHYERALATGDKTKEDLYYEYAILLIRLGADREEIARAVGTWKHYFPFSTKPDPSTASNPPASQP